MLKEKIDDILEEIVPIGIITRASIHSLHWIEVKRDSANKNTYSLKTNYEKGDLFFVDKIYELWT